MELAEMAPSHLRSWLAGNRPDDSCDRAFWWENLMYRALFAMYKCKSEPQRMQYAVLAKEAIYEAVRDGHASPASGAVRIADLTTEYFLRGGGDTDMVSVDEAVGRNLGLIVISPSVAVMRARQLQNLSFGELQELDEARDLIRSCVDLVNRVEDAKLAEQFAEWLDVWGDLN
ncbi:hypothetical protein [Polymorphospora rubra]|uniref:hypothetical protein n=1 Tax=Polymorphospora rubra TaxID=338584 RepID=UPI0033C2E583